MRAVLILERPVRPEELLSAALRLNEQRIGKEKTLAVSAAPRGRVVVVDDHDSHTPARLLVKAKSLATALGHRCKVVAPPR